MSNSKVSNTGIYKLIKALDVYFLRRLGEGSPFLLSAATMDHGPLNDSNDWLIKVILMVV
jgi:hypothetical protein